MGAAAFVLAGSAALAAPGTASADTLTATCGSTITAHPGDHVQATTPLLGLPIDLGIVGQASGVLTGTINAVLGTVCKVTVNVVNTVVAPVPVVGAPVASAVNGAVAGGTSAAQQGVAAVGQGFTGSQPGKQNPGPNPQQPPSGGNGGSPQQGGSPGGQQQSQMPGSTSPVLGDFGGAGGGGAPFSAFLPNFSDLSYGYNTGYAPMRDYSGIPMAMAGLFSPSPSLRYGSQIPGYAPQYGVENPDGSPGGDRTIQNAGNAEALPGTGGNHTNGLDWPVLVAVLALSGVSAGLVRTWVLRRMAAVG
ncbi:hypothetical protein CU254_38975 [Amycolatopsis sp. AA4]|uniref:hypothetical protein n=1 Tax=Actinomycetes TaxID=1760 RepID=UPI0001B56BDF|nr:MULTISPECIES: hypothetical protein [Actinomycetes]ATY15710.1 hypothetical protein CU254_38975 [Amycolatopsis sp. AA4]